MFNEGCPLTIQQIFTMNEAASRLRISRRSLQDVVRVYPYYFLNGRRKLFTEGDLAKIVEGLRPPTSISTKAAKKRIKSPTPSQAEEHLRTRLVRKDVRRRGL